MRHFVLDNDKNSVGHTLRKVMKNIRASKLRPGKFSLFEKRGDSIVLLETREIGPLAKYAKRPKTKNKQTKKKTEEA